MEKDEISKEARKAIDAIEFISSRMKEDNSPVKDSVEMLCYIGKKLKDEERMNNCIKAMAIGVLLYELKFEIPFE